MVLKLTFSIFVFIFLGVINGDISIARNYYTQIGTSSSPNNAEVSIQLARRYQSYNANPKDILDVYDPSINSPKSVNILNGKKKFYINSLEGSTTSAYSLADFHLLKVIKHEFNSGNQYLFSNDFDSNFSFSTKKIN